jgi:hypothetical protein
MLKNSITGSTKYVDVGTLWGTENETVSRAKKFGAESTTIIDIQVPENELLGKMKSRLDELDVDSEFISGDIRRIYAQHEFSF